MPDIAPIPTTGWVMEKAGKRLHQMYPGRTRFHTASLPEWNIMPEAFARSSMHEVEMMLACIEAGAWRPIGGVGDWRKCVRYTIAKRLRVRGQVIFQEPFASIRQTVLDYQLYGGTFKNKEDIQEVASDWIRHPEGNLHISTTARLLLSLTSEPVLNTLIQPFHWLRAVMASSESNSAFSMALMASEMYRQKATLCTMLRAHQSGLVGGNV